MKKNGYEISFFRTAGDNVLGGRIWIDKQGRNFIGLGKIVFLEAIREHGSISAAASSLNMSYRKAWGLAQSINALSDEPLVTKQAGGAGGGGAELTEEGERVISLYWDICRKFEKFLEVQQELIERF